MRLPRRLPWRGRIGWVPVPVFAAVAAVIAVAVTMTAAVGGSRLLSAHAAADAAVAVNMNCTLILPANPLTAQGLATPYQLTATNPDDGPCNEANTLQTAFVQGAVIDPATGKISVYNPLVINAGTQPAQRPVVPALPAGGIVALWFGFNGKTLTLAGADRAFARYQGTGNRYGNGNQQNTRDNSRSRWHHQDAGTTSQTLATAGQQGTFPSQGAFPQGGVPAQPNPVFGPAASPRPDGILQQANCVAGEDFEGQFSPFTQVAGCNAVAFFQAANAAIKAGKLRVPAPGTGKDGLACLMTRSFALIDQDQSDNVTTQYLVNAVNQIAQDTTANRQALPGAATLSNGSDNGLLDQFVAPALGCHPWTAPDLANGGAPATALPLDELQSAAFAGTTANGGPAALVPLNDPMTLNGNGRFSVSKTNAYRSITDQPALPAGEPPQQYCADMEQIQPARLQKDVNLLIGQVSPLPLMADNLFTFLANRLQQSFVNLKCANFGMQNDVSITKNGNGVAVFACFLNQVAPVTPGAGNPTAGVMICPPTLGRGRRYYNGTGLSASEGGNGAGTGTSASTMPGDSPRGRRYSGSQQGGDSQQGGSQQGGGSNQGGSQQGGSQQGGSRQGSGSQQGGSRQGSGSQQGGGSHQGGSTGQHWNGGGNPRLPDSYGFS